MRFPEAAVKAGVFGSLGRCFGKFMDFRQREMAKRESEARPEIPLHSFDDRVGAAAIRALVVAIFEKCHRRIVRTLDVVAGVDWHTQYRHGYASLVSRFCRASRMPSAPGSTATGDR